MGLVGGGCDVTLVSRPSLNPQKELITHIAERADRKHHAEMP